MILIRKRRTQGENARSVDPNRAEIVQSSSDMFIGLLFIFLIMIVVLAIKQRDILGQPLPDQQIQKDPTALLIEDLGTLLNKSGIKVVADPKSGTLTLPSDALFEIGQSDLSPQGKEAISKLTGILSNEIVCFVSSEVEKSSKSQCPQRKRLFEIETVFVEGHTDDKPLMRGPYNNWHLALDRARSVSTVMADGKMGKFKNAREQNVIAFSSYADQRPVDLARPDLNRRVELRFVTSLKTQENILKAKTVGELIESLGQ